MPTREELAKLIENPEFRREFVGDFVQQMIATQIRALRERLGLSQEQVGEAAGGMSQVQVSRLENPDYSGATVNSIKRMAQAFDVGLIVRLASYSEFLDWIEHQSPQTLSPLTYDEEQELRVAIERLQPLADASFVTETDTLPPVSHPSVHVYFFGPPHR